MPKPLNFKAKSNTKPSENEQPCKTLAFRFSLYSLATISLYAFTIGFFPLHLRSQGFSPFDIALVSAASTLANIVGAPLALQLAHSTWPARKILLSCSTLALVGGALLLKAQTLVTVFTCYLICMVSKRGADSLVDATAVRNSASGLIRFEHVRLWGSIGFVLTAFVIGTAVDRIGTPAIVPSGVCILIAILLGSIFLLPALNKQKAHSTTPIDASFKHLPHLLPSALYLLLCSGLIWSSQGVLYVYLSIYLSELGWSGALISTAWNIAVAAEIVFFAVFPFLEQKLSLVGILRLSCLLTVIRWLILASSTNTYILLSSQLLHAFTFGGCYLTTVKLTYEVFPAALRDRGQGILVATGQGIGSGVGKLIAGLGAAQLASYQELNILFYVAAVLAALAFLFTGKIRVKPSTEKSPDS